MNLQGIIDSIADQADELLADASNRKEARTSIGEVLNSRYPRLGGIERQKVTDEVMSILEEEDFFEGSAGDDEFADSDAEESDE
jgi:hypothetical protein